MTTRCKLATVLAACLIVQLCVQLGAVRGDVQNRLTADELRDGWTLLFDGRTLNGWRAYNRPDASGTQWKVEDGQLTVPPSGGRDTRGARDLITTATFRQFDLTWEWRIAVGGNSGLKYFVLEDRDAAIGHEYQMIDDERHPDAKIGTHRQTAAFYDVFPAANRPIKPAGEVNTSRVLVRRLIPGITQAVSAAAGGVWVTSVARPSRSRVFRLDPKTLAVELRLALP